MVLGGAPVVGVVGCAGVGVVVVVLAAVGLEVDAVATVGMKPTVSIEGFFLEQQALGFGCCCGTWLLLLRHITYVLCSAGW